MPLLFSLFIWKFHYNFQPIPVMKLDFEKLNEGQLDMY